MVARYPKAQWLGDGTEYGPLPDKGYDEEDIRVILHTTETTGLPGYGDGDSAPHYTYDPQDRKWYGHADLDHRVGTDKSAGNPVSVAVEMICYSDKAIADGHSSRLWVGDFTDEMKQDIVDFLVWLRDEVYPHMNYGSKVYGPSQDFATFIYGSSASTRMSWAEWDAFGGGLTGHGASPSGSTHWDTGAFDLHEIAEMTADEIVPPPPPSVDGGVLWCRMGDQGNVVKYWQQALWRMGLLEKPIDGIYDERTRAAVYEIRDRKNGEVIDFLQGHLIHRAWIQYEIDQKLPTDPS